MKYSFRNDYSEIGHPEILKLLLENAYKQNIGYGFDEETKNLQEKISSLVGRNVNIVLTSAGTQTNLTVISKILKTYEAVISVETGHINVHETGAIEGTGHKVICVPGVDGKIRPSEIEKVIKLHSDCHMVYPKLVYFSNSTEVGTSYTKKELEEIYSCCKKLGLYVFIDGARLSQALIAEGLTLKDIVDNSDVFYLGGTKNGLPYGEMIVIKDEDIYQNFHYHLKNRGAMLAKTYVVSMMFNRLLEDDLYLINAKNANNLCQELKKELLKLNVEICFPNKTNQLFIKLPKKTINELSTLYAFEVWEDLGELQIIRIVTSWATNKEIIKEFISDLEKMDRSL